MKAAPIVRERVRPLANAKSGDASRDETFGQNELLRLHPDDHTDVLYSLQRIRIVAESMQCSLRELEGCAVDRAEIANIFDLLWDEAQGAEEKMHHAYVLANGKAAGGAAT